MTAGRPQRILVAGFGNELRGDDGFGIAVIDALGRGEPLPPEFRCVEVGTAGLHLVGELFDGYSGLIVVDAVDRGGPAGTLYVLEVQVPSAAELSQTAQHALAVDMHEAVPDRALMVAAAAGALPARVYLVGCQTAITEDFCTELSEPVRAAVPRAADAVRSLLENWRTHDEAVRG